MIKLLKITLLILSLIISSCGYSKIKRINPQEFNPTKPWDIPEELNEIKLPNIEKEKIFLPQGDNPLTLKDIIDITLQNNIKTKSAWLQLKSAYLKLNESYSDYFPSIDLSGSLAYGKTSAATTVPKLSYGASINLNYLLFDFSKRESNLESFLASYIGAGLNYNFIFQSVVFQAKVAYIEYFKIKSLIESANTNLKEVEQHLDMVYEKQKAGLATLSDILQAKTAVSQAKLLVETLKGEQEIIKGSLANVMGIPINTPLNISDLPEDIPLDNFTKSVSFYIEEALKNRPDLMALRAKVLKYKKDSEIAKKESLPTLLFSANIGRNYIYDLEKGSPYIDNYSASINLKYPLFTGFENHYKAQRAEVESKIIELDAQNLQNQIILDVWQSYYSLNSAIQTVKASQTLLESALESEKITFEKYKAGLGSILDNLSAQSSLSDARAKNIQAKANLFLALANIARSIGTLDNILEKEK